MSKKRSARKVRVDFRQNRQTRRRNDEWTRQFKKGEDRIVDTHLSESVRAKGELSRKRTILVGADDAPIVDEALWRPGRVTRVHGLIVFVDEEPGRDWQCTVRRVLRTRLIEQRSAVTVGDRVWFSEDPGSTDAARIGVIERVEDRRTLLSRGARVGHDETRRGHRRQHLIAANVDQLLIVASVAQPRLKPHLIDRYLVAAHKGDLRPIICFHKCDLLDRQELRIAEHAEDGHVAVEARVGRGSDAGDGLGDDAEYIEVDDASPLAVFDEMSRLGYACLWTSSVTGAGLDRLADFLRGHLTVFSGQSGVGKSSIANAIQPGLNLPIQDVSEETEKGRHTTSHAELHRLNFGGYIVDTPGIRAFDLWDVQPGELEAYFVEFVPHIQKCRFSNCTHRHEESCAVKAAMESGEISARRYYSYVKMFAEV
jgi:ribosome biogenesis GTPase